MQQAGIGETQRTALEVLSGGQALTLPAALSTDILHPLILAKALKARSANAIADRLASVFELHDEPRRNPYDIGAFHAAQRADKCRWVALECRETVPHCVGLL
jgi:hypothetical protein